MLTLDSNFTTLEEASALKESAIHAKKQRALEQNKKKLVKAQEKAAKAQKHHEKQEEKGAKDWLNEYWKEVAAQGWGNKLQQLLKSNRPPLSGSYVSDNPPIVYLQPARLVLEVEISEGRHPGLAMVPLAPLRIHQV